MKKKILSISSLIILSFISFLAYYMEVLHHGWEGLKWTGNFYWSLLFIPFVFVLWLKFLVIKELRIKQILKFLISYFLTYAGIFVLLNFIYNLRLTAFLIFLPFEEILSPAFFDFLVYLSILINTSLIFLILYIENTKLQKLLNFELKKFEKIILFFQPVFIFLSAELLMILLYYLKVFPLMNRFDIIDSIFIFKTGTIIFSSVLFEGLYIFYKKSSSDETKN